MARSLKKQVSRRLLAAFMVSALAVIAATLWFKSRAEEKMLLSRQQSIRGTYRVRIADVHQEWEERATQFAEVLEFTSVLEARRPELLSSLLLTQGGDTSVPYAILLDPRGAPLLHLGFEQDVGELARQVAAQEPWLYEPLRGALYHVSRTPVRMGGEGSGVLFLLHPMDHALLGRLVAPDIDLYLLLEGRPVASSLGQPGVDRFAAGDGKSSEDGGRTMQVTVPWGDSHGRAVPAPALVVRRRYRESVSLPEIALIVLASLVVLAATSWIVLGGWISGIVGTIVKLKTRAYAFARERALPLGAKMAGTGLDRSGDDELGALSAGLEMLMRTVVESEQRSEDGATALRKEHDFNASLVATAPVVILLLDLKGAIQYVNPYFEQLARCRLDEVRGRDWFATFVPEAEQQRIRDQFQAVLREGAVRDSINRIVTLTGEERVIEWSAQTMRDPQGSVMALLSIGLDLTERTHAEEKYAHILQTAIDGFWTTDTRGRLLEVNESYCRMSGYRRDELLGMSIPDLEAVEDPDETARHIRALIACGSERFESKHRRKDGTVFDVDASVQYSNLQGGIFICFVKDITERKRVEKALQQSEERLRQAMDATHDGLWDWNLATGEVYYSPSYFRMLGYEPGELSGGLEVWTGLIHPDDLQEALRINHDCIENRIRNFEIEFRMRSKRDGWVWILGRGQAVLRDRNGRALRIVGTHVDLTAIKLAEGQLRSALAEKELLLREVHHRVKNNLQVIGSLLYLQAEQETQPHTLKLLQESRDRIKSIALVHERLFGARDLSCVDLAGYLESLAGHLSHVHDAGRRGVRVAVEVREVALGIDTAAPCGLIANELISNALKYAFPGGRPGVVRVTASRGAGGVVTLVIADDGVGLPAGLDLERLPSLGLRLVHQLVKQLHGSLEVSSNGGTRFRISFNEGIERAKECSDDA